MIIKVFIFFRLLRKSENTKSILGLACACAVNSVFSVFQQILIFDCERLCEEPPRGKRGEWVLLLIQELHPLL